MLNPEFLLVLISLLQPEMLLCSILYHFILCVKMAVLCPTHRETLHWLDLFSPEGSPFIPHCLTGHSASLSLFRKLTYVSCPQVTGVSMPKDSFSFGFLYSAPCPYARRLSSVSPGDSRDPLESFLLAPVKSYLVLEGISSSANMMQRILP